MSFGSKVVAIRKEKNMSQDELAKALNATPTTIGRYERDEVKPSIEVARKIADVLEVSLDYLTGDENTPLKDKKMLQRFREILALKEDDKKNIINTIDALLRDAKARQAYGNAS